MNNDLTAALTEYLRLQAQAMLNALLEADKQHRRGIR